MEASPRGKAPEEGPGKATASPRVPWPSCWEAGVHEVPEAMALLGKPWPCQPLAPKSDARARTSRIGGVVQDTRQPLLN